MIELVSERCGEGQKEHGVQSPEAGRSGQGTNRWPVFWGGVLTVASQQRKSPASAEGFSLKMQDQACVLLQEEGGRIVKSS